VDQFKTHRFAPKGSLDGFYAKIQISISY